MQYDVQPNAEADETSYLAVTAGVTFAAVNELGYLMEAFQITQLGTPVHGCIQGIGTDIFHLPLYLQEQVDAFIEYCQRESGGVIHVDATGSVIAKNVSELVTDFSLFNCIFTFTC